MEFDPNIFAKVLKEVRETRTSDADALTRPKIRTVYFALIQFDATDSCGFMGSLASLDTIASRTGCCVQTILPPFIVVLGNSPVDDDVCARRRLDSFVTELRKANLKLKAIVGHEQALMGLFSRDHAFFYGAFLETLSARLIELLALPSGSIVKQE